MPINDVFDDQLHIEGFFNDISTMLTLMRIVECLLGITLIRLFSTMYTL